MEISIGDIVEVTFLKTKDTMPTVFGQLLNANNEKITMSIWDAPEDIMEYDEININLSSIVSVELGGTCEETIEQAMFDPNFH